MLSACYLPVLEALRQISKGRPESRRLWRRMIKRLHKFSAQHHRMFSPWKFQFYGKMHDPRVRIIWTSVVKFHKPSCEESSSPKKLACVIDLEKLDENLSDMQTFPEHGTVGKVSPCDLEQHHCRTLISPQVDVLPTGNSCVNYSVASVVLLEAIEALHHSHSSKGELVFCSELQSISEKRAAQHCCRNSCAILPKK